MKLLKMTGILILICLSVLAINLTLNTKLRSWVKLIFESHKELPSKEMIVLGDDNMIYVDDLSEEALEAFEKTGHYFIKLAWLRYADITYQLDTSLNQLNIIGASQNIEIEANGNMTLNGAESSGKITLRTIGGEKYIALDQLLSYGDFHLYYQYFSDTDVLLVTTGNFSDVNAVTQSATYVYIDEDAMIQEFSSDELKEWRSIFKGADITEKLDANEKVYVMPLEDENYFILTANGNVGYVPERSIMINELPQDQSFLSDKTRSDEPIHLVWEAVYTKNPNTENIGELNGINVISPSWYVLEDDSGTVIDKSSADYINWVKQNEFQIWPLVSNDFDPDKTHAFLNNANARRNFIEFIVEEAITKGYDGVNIDFENIYLEDKNALSHFINELSWYLKPLDITLSMDVTVIAESDNWSKCFDRAVLGKIVDYLIVMTYDEYWASSPLSGPVASYDWVENGLKKIIEIVPSEKIIMGIPLYTRVWTETVDSSKVNKYNNSAVSIGIDAQNVLITDKQLEITWLENDQLFYTAYQEDGLIKKIWVENAETIKRKISLSDSLNLAGQAYWRRGLEPSGFWREIY